MCRRDSLLCDDDKIKEMLELLERIKGLAWDYYLEVRAPGFLAELDKIKYELNE